jgi:Domain of unknown function (DUF4258)
MNVTTLRGAAMYRHETGKLHGIARSRDFRLVVSDHAAVQMRDRKVARFEVERVLKAGAVVMVETDVRGRVTWRDAGHDADGRRIEPVVEVRPPNMMAVVTVIRVG